MLTLLRILRAEIKKNNVPNKAEGENRFRQPSDGSRSRDKSRPNDVPGVLYDADKPVRTGNSDHLVRYFDVLMFKTCRLGCPL